MELDPTETGYKYKFNARETRTIKGAYTEHVVEELNSGSKPDFEDFTIAAWEEPALSSFKSYETKNPTNIRDRLNGFDERTDEAVKNIAESSDVPAHQNSAVAERHLLGRDARNMVEEIDKKLESIYEEEAENSPSVQEQKMADEVRELLNTLGDTPEREYKLDN